VQNKKVKVHVCTVGDTTRQISSADTVEIPTGCWRVVRVRHPRDCRASCSLSDNWMVDPGVLPPYSVSARVALSVLDGLQGVLVTNVGDAPVVIVEGTPLGVAEKVSIMSALLSVFDDPPAADTPAGRPVGQQPTDGHVRTAGRFVDDCDMDSDHYDSDNITNGNLNQSAINEID
jgi:hypothetical protein